MPLGHCWINMKLSMRLRLPIAELEHYQNNSNIKYAHISEFLLKGTTFVQTMHSILIITNTCIGSKLTVVWPGDSRPCVSVEHVAVTFWREINTCTCCTHWLFGWSEIFSKMCSIDSYRQGPI